MIISWDRLCSKKLLAHRNPSRNRKVLTLGSMGRGFGWREVSWTIVCLVFSFAPLSPASVAPSSFRIQFRIPFAWSPSTSRVAPFPEVWSSYNAYQHQNFTLFLCWAQTRTLRVSRIHGEMFWRGRSCGIGDGVRWEMLRQVGAAAESPPRTSQIRETACRGTPSTSLSPAGWVCLRWLVFSVPPTLILYFTLAGNLAFKQPFFSTFITLWMCKSNQLML